MKQIMYGIVTTTAVFLVVLSIMVIVTRTHEESMLNENVSLAAKETIRMLNQQRSIAETDEQLVLLFEKNLLCRMNLAKDESIKIVVSEADAAKGILAVNVTKEFRYPNNSKGHASATSVAIIDQSEENMWVEIKGDATNGKS